MTTRYQQLKREQHSKGYADGYQQAMSEIAALIEQGEPRAAIAQWVSTAVGREIVTICQTCTDYATDSALENLRDAYGVEPDWKDVQATAREYVRTEISTLCDDCATAHCHRSI